MLSRLCTRMGIKTQEYLASSCEKRKVVVILNKLGNKTFKGIKENLLLRITSGILGSVLLVGSVGIVGANAAEVSVEPSQDYWSSSNCVHMSIYNTQVYNSTTLDKSVKSGFWKENRQFNSTLPASFYVGDLDYDGYITTLDLDMLRNVINNGYSYWSGTMVADIDGDRKITEKDYWDLLAYLNCRRRNPSVAGKAGYRVSTYACLVYANATKKKQGLYYAKLWKYDFDSDMGTDPQCKYYIKGKSVSQAQYFDYIDW